MLRYTPLLLVAIACSSEPPEPPEPLSDCSAKDPIDVLGLVQDGTTLDINFGHAGGCAEHQVSACWSGNVDTSAPPQVGLTLWHDDGGDSCEA
ncbi:MAG: hypothetical protein AB8H79_15205, partial [Myxococcota bacterium]